MKIRLMNCFVMFMQIVQNGDAKFSHIDYNGEKGLRMKERMEENG